MIESADYLVHKHFGKLLSDPGVEILDPCTGTGTFVTELIEYLPADKLEHKYKNEIHCNEVAILPYYIANLNIEFTYQQKMEKYEECKNICLVDTLDHCIFEGQQFDLFAMSVQNTGRIQDQNARTISVIIGNPPYNANQENENDDNKNRKYPAIDKQIKDTYLRSSDAQKTKLYDMYTRFFRWATSRLDNDGILAFITNSSFVDTKNFDGFRKVASREFSEIYIIDLGGDVRNNPKLSGTTHNVFGIQTGVAISFMIRKRSTQESCKIFHTQRPKFELAEDKLRFLSGTSFPNIAFDHLQPDKKGNWINIANNNFDLLISLASKAKLGVNDPGIFQKFYLGVSTNRDEWIYDYSEKSLADKSQFLCKNYNSDVKEYQVSKNINAVSKESIIKWSETLKQNLKDGSVVKFSTLYTKKILYRPYFKKLLYFDTTFIDRPGRIEEFLPSSKVEYENRLISYSFGKRGDFSVLAASLICSLDVYLPNAARCLPLYRYDKNGNRIDNITDWGLTQFQAHYNDRTITKQDIFHYTYAVLHHPAYRTKYELNLKREFPRLPFYADFHQWATWGKALMDLHLNYEAIAPYELSRVEIATKDNPKAKLKADKVNGVITLDENTELTGVPAIAWDYKLGNRSALEWILDQYKEKKPKDPTIAKLFNTYKFADYKE